MGMRVRVRGGHARRRREDEEGEEARDRQARDGGARQAGASPRAALRAQRPRANDALVWARTEPSKCVQLRPRVRGEFAAIGGVGEGGAGESRPSPAKGSARRASEGCPGRSCREWSGWDGRGGASGAASPSLSPKPFRRRDPSTKRRAHGRSAPCARSLAICSEPPLTGSGRVFARA